MDRSNGDRLRRLRGNKSRKVVADACGISVSALSNYENDIRTPKDDIKKALSTYYGKSVNYLFFSVKTHNM